MMGRAWTEESLREAWPGFYVVSDRGCHEWSRARDWRGYGRLRMKGRSPGAHRLAYELFVGPIPEGQVVRHRCDNPCCVNPDHLEVGTHVDNARDCIERSPVPYGRPWALPGPLWPIFLKRLKDTGLSYDRLGRKFGVSPQTIQRTINR